jgi:hypothetical protein
MYMPRTVLSTVLSISGLLVGGGAYASHIGEELLSDQTLVVATDSLVSEIQVFENLLAPARAARESHIAKLAEKRKEVLLRLLEKNPELVASRMLPNPLRSRLPTSALVHVEDDADESGELFAAISDDFVNGVSKQKIFAKESQPRTHGGVHGRPSWQCPGFDPCIWKECQTQGKEAWPKSGDT